jgi:GNAT superfamily N-acetyltransferase
MMDVQIRLLRAQDISGMVNAFRAIGWKKTAKQYEQYLAEQQKGSRIVLVAFTDETFCGYITVNWQSSYLPFQAENIPEIVDFNVLPDFRRRGIGTRLIDEAEQRIAQRSPIAGIGVGMLVDYGAAQRLYVKRGYIPDGRGLLASGQFVKFGQRVRVDDDLVLYFTKDLKTVDTAPHKDN